MDIPAWLQAIGALAAIGFTFWTWRHDRKFLQDDRLVRARSLAIALLPLVERVKERTFSQFDRDAFWLLLDEHENAGDAYKIGIGLPSLLSDLHLLPQELALEVQRLWRMVQAHDSLIDRIKRASESRGDERDSLRKTLEATEPKLAEQAELTLQALRTYLDREFDCK